MGAQPHSALSAALTLYYAFHRVASSCGKGAMSMSKGVRFPHMKEEVR